MPKSGKTKRKRKLKVVLVFPDLEFKRACHYVHDKVFAAKHPLTLHGDLLRCRCGRNGVTTDISSEKIRQAVWHLNELGYVKFTPAWEIVLGY